MEAQDDYFVNLFTPLYKILSELRCACSALGIRQPIVLNYQDGELADINPDKIVSEILAVISQLRPQIMISFGEDGLSGHPDHIAIGRYALEAFNQTKDVNAFYALAVPQSIVDVLNMTQIKPVQDSSITHIVDVVEAWNDKMAAIRCHRTQMDESPILMGKKQKQFLFLGKEHFRLIAFRKNYESDDLMKWLGKYCL
ncbi:MAG: PIG-L deacetylase family protein [Brevefilum sp.]|nr:PIG-L deacetylase family protein [Brevefilum sp.]